MKKSNYLILQIILIILGINIVAEVPSTYEECVAWYKCDNRLEFVKNDSNLLANNLVSNNSLVINGKDSESMHQPDKFFKAEYLELEKKQQDLDFQKNKVFMLLKSEIDVQKNIELLKELLKIVDEKVQSYKKFIQLLNT